MQLRMCMGDEVWRGRLFIEAVAFHLFFRTRLP